MLPQAPTSDTTGWFARDSETFARAYLEFIDNGTSHGLDKYDEAHNVVHKQFEARLLTGQRTNRPAPPAPSRIDECPTGPYSSIVCAGNSSSIDSRRAEVTPIARSLPDWTCGSAVSGLLNIIVICPPSRSVVAGACPVAHAQSNSEPYSEP